MGKFEIELKSGRLGRIEDKKYLAFVKSLPCMVHEERAEPHHLIGHGYGGTGTKASDYLTFPLSREAHDELHADVKKWEERYWDQWKCVAYTQRRWIEERFPKELKEFPGWVMSSWEEISLAQMQWLMEHKK